MGFLKTFFSGISLPLPHPPKKNGLGELGEDRGAGFDESMLTFLSTWDPVQYLL